MGQQLSSYLTINRCKIWTVAMKPCVVIVLLMMVVKHNNGGPGVYIIETDDDPRRMSGLSEDELTVAFEQADQDENGKLTAAELQKGLMLIFANNDEEKRKYGGMVDMMVNDFDQDGDEMLNYEEMFNALTTLTEGDIRTLAVAGRRGGGGGGCFPGSSLVKLSSGESRPMRDVETGDSVMTMVEGRMTTTKVLGFVAKSVSSSTEYLNIRTEDGRSLSISQTHVMFVSDPYGNSKDVMAKDVNIGDRVMVQDGDHVKKSVVVEIGLEAMVGAYVPLTEHGTLMVDDVLCSCYTNCDHPTVHLLFSPARWFPSLFLTDTEGGTIYSRLGPHVGYYLHKIGMLNYFHSNTLQRARAETQDVEKTMDAETSFCMAPALVHDVCPSFNFMKL